MTHHFLHPCPAFRPYNLINQISSLWGPKEFPVGQGGWLPESALSNKTTTPYRCRAHQMRELRRELAKVREMVGSHCS